MFGPDDEIIPEQMTAMIANFVDYTGLERNVQNEATAFADNDAISTWAKDAVKNMQGSGIINGKPNQLFDSQGTATRAEVATPLKRFIENVVA